MSRISQRLLVSSVVVSWLLCFATAASAQTASVRQPADAQIVLEVRLLTISEPVCERIGVDFEMIKPADAGKQSHDSSPPSTLTAQDVGVAFLRDMQLFQLMEAAQGDRKTNIVQAPRLALTS